MIEYWERTQISGTDAEGNGMGHYEEVLHRRGEDPLVLACRRNRGLARCNCFVIHTHEAFIQIREERETRDQERQIPKDARSRFEEWEW